MPRSEDATFHPSVEGLQMDTAIFAENSDSDRTESLKLPGWMENSGVNGHLAATPVSGNIAVRLMQHLFWYFSIRGHRDSINAPSVTLKCSVLRAAGCPAALNSSYKRERAPACVSYITSPTKTTFPNESSYKPARGSLKSSCVRYPHHAILILRTQRLNSDLELKDGLQQKIGQSPIVSGTPRPPIEKLSLYHVLAPCSQA